VEQLGGDEANTETTAGTRSAKDDRAEATRDAVAHEPDAAAQSPDVRSGASPDAALTEHAATDASVKPAADAVATSDAGESGAASTLDRIGVSRAAQPSLHGAQETETSAPVDRARFIQRVEGAVRRAHERDGRVQVRLSPPELGNLRIEIALSNGVLTAKLEAETPAARNLLMDNLPALRERLAQQEIRVEKFDVDVRRDGAGGGGGDHSARDRAADKEPWRQNDNRPKPSATRTGAPAPVRPAGVKTSEAGLDVRV
jgi:flagellar hook-length control protein FliK